MSRDIDQRNAIWDMMRTHVPVFWDQGSGCHLLTRYCDARDVLASKAMWKDADKAEEGALVRTFKSDNPRRPEDRNSGMIWMDDPHHARVRTPIALALHRRIARARPVIEDIVARRLKHLSGHRSFEVLSDYAIPISTEVIGRLLGVTDADMDQFRTWAEDDTLQFEANPTPEESARLLAANEGFGDYLAAAIADRRSHARDDLVSDLVAAQAAGDQISDSEIRVNCQSLLGGGNRTTADLIASTVFLLLRHPEQLARLRSEPGLIASAIEETLRYEPPADGTQRIASENLEISGCPIRRTQVVAIAFGAANRDPQAFEDPHRFDIAREHVPHVSFGGGAHFCIGAPLARSEAQVAVAALLRRYPQLALGEGMEHPVWRTKGFFHGLERLNVVA